MNNLISEGNEGLVTHDTSMCGVIKSLELEAAEEIVPFILGFNYICPIGPLSGAFNECEGGNSQKNERPESAHGLCV